MITEQNSINKFDEGANRILIDLVFDLAAGEPIRNDITYEQQLGCFISQVIPDYANLDRFVEYGQKYRGSSKHMFPGKPEKIKNRGNLIKLFTNFVVLKEIYDCGSYEAAVNAPQIAGIVTARFTLQNEEDQNTFLRETAGTTKRYAEVMNEASYQAFMSVMPKVAEEFDSTYLRIVQYVAGDVSGTKAGSFAAVLDVYNIPQSEAIKFQLVVDAIAETIVIKNQCLEYEEELKKEWENRFPKLKYGMEVEEYARSKKSAYVVSYGNRISSIRNESFLFMMLADVTVKLALVDGAKNRQDLTQKIKELTSELGNNIKDIFIDSRKNVVRCYHLSGKEDYPSDLGSVLIPYRSALIYLKDIIIEEISYRNAENIVQKQTRKTKDADEYELLLSQKDAEIYDLRHELEYYENIKQQEFKAEISQYNRALTDLFRKMCDFKYNSPLNELYLLANGSKDISIESARGILQNLLFILSTMNIVPYETGNVGKKVKFYDDEANIIYAVEDSKVKEGLNQGVQVYPGWKYKDTELVLPKVDIKEE